MKKEGPLLEQLTHRLSECPSEFLMEPKITRKGAIHVDAVVSDLIMDLGGNPPEEKDLEMFGPNPGKGSGWPSLIPAGSEKHINFLRLVLVCSWLFHDEWFRDAKQFDKRVLAFLREGLFELVDLIKAELFVSDPDRREELARMCLDALELRPNGESEAQATDRLDTLSSVKRYKIMQATREKQERARKIRQAMEEQKAREAAARYSPE